MGDGGLLGNAAIHEAGNQDLSLGNRLARGAEGSASGHGDILDDSVPGGCQVAQAIGLLLHGNGRRLFRHAYFRNAAISIDPYPFKLRNDRQETIFDLLTAKAPAVYTKPEAAVLSRRQDLSGGNPAVAGDPEEENPGGDQQGGQQKQGHPHQQQSPTDQALEGVIESQVPLDGQLFASFDRQTIHGLQVLAANPEGQGQLPHR